MLSTEDYGLFQIRITVVVCVMALFNGVGLFLSSIFAVYTPPHRCYVAEIDSNLYPAPCDLRDNNNSMIGEYIPTQWDETSQTTVVSKCSHYDWSKPNATREAVACDKGWKYCRKNEVYTATVEFDLVCDKAWLVPLIPCCLMLGNMIGDISGGMFSDRYGRRLTIIIGWILFSCSITLMAVTPVWVGIHILTFVQGLASTFRTSAGLVLLSEISPSRHRYKVSIINVASIALGGMFLPLIAYLVPNWRFMTTVVAILQLSVVAPSFLVLRNSLKWLLENQKYQEARSVLVESSRLNQVKLNHDDLENLQWGRRQGTDDDRKEPPQPPRANRRFSYVDFAHITFLRKRVLILSLAWFASSMPYYGLSLNTRNLEGNRFLIFLGVTAIELPGHLLAYVVLRKMGSRNTFMILAGLCGTTLLITPLVQQASKLRLIVCNMIGKLFASGCFSLLYTFTGELFPTLLRTQSYGICSFAARCAGVIVPYLLYLGNHIHGLPYLVMGCLMIGAVLLMCFLPSTKSLTLPDTIEEAKLQDY
ncbi:organic cation transporter protein-like isoform X1 [Clavelina lepadiformis]|uniref:organic cation transporter protein-like isoform X1 n=1 Tax=Clavelina lepadiformis TaxID=159417 RepID=UPI0040412FDB